MKQGLRVFAIGIALCVVASACSIGSGGSNSATTTEPPITTTEPTTTATEPTTTTTTPPAPAISVCEELVETDEGLKELRATCFLQLLDFVRDGWPEEQKLVVEEADICTPRPADFVPGLWMSIRILPEAASGDETLPDAPTPSVDTPAILRSVERDIAFVLMAFVQYADVFGIESGVLMTIEHPTGASILAVGELTELPNDDILDMAELERAISGGDQKAITEWMREFDRSVSSFMEPLEYMVLPSTEGLSMTSMLLAEIRALKRTFSPSRLNCHIRLIGKKGT